MGGLAPRQSGAVGCRLRDGQSLCLPRCDQAPRPAALRRWLLLVGVVLAVLGAGGSISTGVVRAAPAIQVSTGILPAGGWGLPFGPGHAWQVIQGYKTGFTHGAQYPDEAFALDLVLAEKDTRGRYVEKRDPTTGQSATRGQPVLAMAAGVVVWRQPETGCIALRHDELTREVAVNRDRPSTQYVFTTYCHLQVDSQGRLVDPRGTPIEAGTTRFTRGQQIGRADNAGTDRVHLHVHAFTKLDDPSGDKGGRTPVPLVGMAARVLAEGDGTGGGYTKSDWTDTGGTNQYLGWVLAADEATAVASTTMLVVDVSSSMRDPDEGGTAKIDAARESARRIASMLEVENVRGGQHQIGLVTFGDDARTLLAPTTDVQQLRAALDRLAASGNTRLASGLQQGAGLLGQGGRRVLVLLTDGVPTLDAGGRRAGSPDEIRAFEREVLERTLPAALPSIDCLFVVGLGDPRARSGDVPSIDEAFLRQLAGATSCGGYARAGNLIELTNVYVRQRHEAVGTVLATIDGRIRQGETTEPAALIVPDGQGELHVTLDWPGSKLDLILVDPLGRIVDAAYPGAQLFEDRLPVYVVVSDPQAGTWQVQVRGVDVPAGGTVYGVVASVRAAAATGARVGGISSASLVLLLILVLAGAAAVAVVAGGGGRLGRPAGYLRPSWERGMPPILVPIDRLPFTIGRDPRCSLVLSDLGVSRLHARIARVGGVVIVEDLGSRNGIFVDGRRVARTRLVPGTQLQLGRASLTFESAAPAAAPMAPAYGVPAGRR